MLPSALWRTHAAADYSLAELKDGDKNLRKEKAERLVEHDGDDAAATYKAVLAARQGSVNVKFDSNHQVTAVLACRLAPRPRPLPPPYLRSTAKARCAPAPSVSVARSADRVCRPCVPTVFADRFCRPLSRPLRRPLRRPLFGSRLPISKTST